MDLTELLRASPQFHQGASGRSVSWGLRPDVLSFIDTEVTAGSATLEVGAGVSTVLFALKGTTHVCVVPDQEQVDRIKAFCAEHRISLQGVRFAIERSEDYLPGAKITDLDLVLIDGAHGFPMPFLDWYYTADRLKVGGIVVVDDTQFWTGHTLKMFLMAEPAWTLARDFAPRSVAFRKVQKDTRGKHDLAQPYVVQQNLDLVFRLYPEHVESIRPLYPEPLVRQRESSLSYRAYRAGVLARSIASRTTPGPVKWLAKKLLGRG